MAANTLTGLVQTIYTALNTVAREQVGLVPAVRKFNYPGKKVAQDESITFPIVPSFSAPTAISASNVISDPAGIVVGKGELTMDNVNAISWGWNGEEAVGLGNSGIFATTQEDAFKQAFRAHANQIEAALALKYKSASAAVGVPGTTPFNTVDNLTDISNCRMELEDNGMWQDGKMKMVLSNSAAANLRGKQTVVFKANEAGSTVGQKTGYITELEGFQIGQSGQIKTHTCGTGALIKTDGTYALGSTSIDTTGGSGTILAGDVIQFAGANRKYVVKTALSGGTLVLQDPGLTTAVANDASCTLFTASSTYKANMAFNEDAIVLVSALPNLPEGGDQAVNRITVQDPVSGLLFEVSEYKGYRKVIYVVAAAWGCAVPKPEGLITLIQ